MRSEGKKGTWVKDKDYLGGTGNKIVEKGILFVGLGESGRVCNLRKGIVGGGVGSGGSE